MQFILDIRSTLSRVSHSGQSATSGLDFILTCGSFLVSYSYSMLRKFFDFSLVALLVASKPGEETTQIKLDFAAAL